MPKVIYKPANERLLSPGMRYLLKLKNEEGKYVVYTVVFQQYAALHPRLYSYSNPTVHAWVKFDDPLWPYSIKEDPGHNPFFGSSTVAMFEILDTYDISPDTNEEELAGIDSLKAGNQIWVGLGNQSKAKLVTFTGEEPIRYNPREIKSNLESIYVSKLGAKEVPLPSSLKSKIAEYLGPSVATRVEKSNEEESRRTTPLPYDAAIEGTIDPRKKHFEEFERRVLKKRKNTDAPSSSSSSSAPAFLGQLDTWEQGDPILGGQPRKRNTRTRRRKKEKRKSRRTTRSSSSSCRRRRPTRRAH